jgi:ubiquinone/menaquinone biosynthesis C-methylase UbiE
MAKVTQDEPIAPFDWFANQFTIEGRAEFVARIGPHLASLFKCGDRVLDLCCGAGPVAFFLEEHGASVTGIDLAPSLIAMARQEAVRRNSQTEFIHANVLTHPLGNEVYDLAVCLGNAILEFPHKSFPGFRDRVFQALKTGGRFAIGYLDGLSRVADMSEPQEVVEQGSEGKILRRFKKYDPALGAYKMEYRHLSRNDTFDYTGYVYTGPLIRIVMETRFEFEQSIRLDKASFLDVYLKR